MEATMLIPEIEKKYRELLLFYATDKKFNEFLNIWTVMFQAQNINSTYNGGIKYNNPYEMLMFQLATIQEKINGGEEVNG